MFFSSFRGRLDPVRVGLRSLGVLIFVVLIMHSPAMLVGLRNRLFGLSSGERMLSHGLGHTLYLGLGTEKNPWGIDYNNDATGQIAVRRAFPSIGFETPAYYQAISRLYWQLVYRHPFEIMKIYARKLGRVIQMPLQIGGIPLFWHWVFWSGVALFLTFKFSDDPLPSCVLLLESAAVCAFCFQGVLAEPSPDFLYPAKFGVVVLIYTCLQYLLLMIFRRDENPRRVQNPV